MSAGIQQYWNTRAAEHGCSPAATTNDIHMRSLEVRTLQRMIALQRLPADSRVLDAGCGDGFTTLAMAEAFPNLRFTGIDYAPAMIETAAKRLADAPGSTRHIRFEVGDVTALAPRDESHVFDLALTCRCLINLENASAQREALQQIAACLKPGARLLAIENFHEGQDAMNAARAAMSLPAIPVRWHNRFFTEGELRDAASGHFDVEEIVDFASAYYFATRVIYSSLCRLRGEEPDYDHDLHRLAVDLPPMLGTRFSPIRMAILRRR